MPEATRFRCLWNRSCRGQGSEMHSFETRLVSESGSSTLVGAHCGGLSSLHSHGSSMWNQFSEASGPRRSHCAAGGRAQQKTWFFLTPYHAFASLSFQQSLTSCEFCIIPRSCFHGYNIFFDILTIDLLTLWFLLRR